jgi:hypothetical protein
MSPTLLLTLMRRRRDLPADPAAWRPPTQSTEVLTEPVAFVELDTRHNDGYTISLEWNRGTDTTRIVVGDIRTARHLVFPVPAALAADAFRHPFRYAP